MGAFEKFVIRLILSVIFAFILSRIFFQKMSPIGTLILACLMLGFAYVLEYFRTRNRGG